MNKRIIWMLALCISFQFAFSQIIVDEEQPEFQVWNVTGKVSYQDADGNTSTVEKGQSLADGGMVILKKKSSLELIYDGKRLNTINKKGTHALNDAKNNVASNAGGVMDDFWATVNMASKGHGGGGGGGTGGGTSGQGKKGAGGSFKILPASPIGTGVPSGEVSFSWIDLEGATKPFHLKVFTKENDTPIFTAVTSKTNFSIDFSQFDVADGEEILWQVVQVGDSNKSDKISFSLTDAAKVAAVQESLKKEKAYQEGDKLQKTLIEGVVYFKNNLNYLAQKAYEKAVKSFPNNKMAKQLYNDFLSKNGMDYLIE